MAFDKSCGLSETLSHTPLLSREISQFSIFDTTCETRLGHRSFPAAAACCVFDLLSQGKPHCAQARGFLIGKPAIAQLVEHLTADFCGNQMVPGSIPGGWTLLASALCIKQPINHRTSCFCSLFQPRRGFSSNTTRTSYQPSPTRNHL